MSARAGFRTTNSPSAPTVGLITFGEATRNPITVKSAEFEVFVVLHLRYALVKVQLVVCNADTQTPVAAKMRFPLPIGATVCRFAFEREAQIYPAVPVPKSKAQSVVYAEKEKGRSVATTRNVQANVFEMEVSPLPYNESRTCEIQFLQPLPALVGESEQFHLPFGFATPLQVLCSVSSFPSVAWTTSIGDERVCSDLSGGVVCKASFLQRSVTNAVVGDAFGHKHFVWRISSDNVSQVLGPIVEGDIHGTRIAVLFDTSASMEAGNQPSIINLLGRLEQKWTSNCATTLAMSLWTFSMGEIKCVVNNGSVTEVCNMLRSLRFDGGTDLKGALDVFADHLTGLSDIHSVLLFSDGIDSLGRRPKICTHALTGPKIRVPIHCLAMSQQIDISLLQMIAHSTGGLCFTTKVRPENVCDAILAGGNSAPYVCNLEVFSNGADVSGYTAFATVPDCRLPQTMWPVEEDGVIVGGRIVPSSIDEIRITLAASGGRRGQLSMKVVDACTLPTEAGPITGWLYCMQSFKEYELLGLPEEATRQYLEQLSATYGLASKVTDLLLLYDAVQFCDHGICCPVDHPANSEWNRIKKGDKRDEASMDQPSDLVGGPKTEAEMNAVSGMSSRLKRYLEDPKAFVGGGGGGGGISEEEEEDGDMDCDLFEGGGSGPRCARRECANAASDASSASDDEECDECEECASSANDDECEECEKCASSANDDECEECEKLSADEGAVAESVDCVAGNSLETPAVVDSAGGVVIDCEAYVRGSEEAYVPILRVAIQEGRWEDEYYKQRKLHAKSPSFYVFVAQLLDSFKNNVDASAPARVLSNCLEIDLQEVQLLRTVGYGLFAYGQPGCAVALFDRVLTLADSEPQSHLDAALARVQCLAGEMEAAMRPAIEAGLKEAACNLANVIQRRWASRFHEVEWPALVLLNALESLQVPTDYAMHDPKAQLLDWLKEASMISITIKKSDIAEKLGVATVSQCSVARQIKGVTEGGLVDKWNQDSPPRLVEPGDLIVDVNGVSGDSDLISAALKSSLVLEIKLAKRYAVPSTIESVQEPWCLWPAGLAENFRIAGGMKVGLLVWMSWDTDHTDVDLHVKEPSGNEVYYSNNRSSIGGLLSKDFTDGYGPEVYLLKDAPCGIYTIRAKYYASHQASKSTGTTSVVLWSFAHLGVPNCAAMDFRTVRLRQGSEMMDVLRVELPEDVYRATDIVTIFASTNSSSSIGKLLPGQEVKAAGPPEVVDGYTMLPIKPEGAVQMKYLGPGTPRFLSA